MNDSAVDQARLAAEASRDHFAEQLRGFVRNWAPRNAHDMHEFQLALTRLMADAMRSKSDFLSFGCANYAASAYEQMALRPLAVIMEGPKR